MDSRRKISFAKLIFLVTCLSAAVFYFALVSSQYFAFYLSEKTDWNSLQLATRLEPWNAEYRDKAGQFLILLQRYPEAATAFSSAANLDPSNAEYWLRLASVENAPNLEGDQEQALNRAVGADPKSPLVLWEVANTLLAQGNTSLAFQYFRSAMQGAPFLTGAGIELCWHASHDVDALLQQAIPPDAAAYSQLLGFLISKSEPTSAAKVWTQIVKLGRPLRLGDIFDYIRYLIGHGDSAQARTVWEQSAPLCELRSYQPSPPNIVINGDFDVNILNGGFDWTYQKQPGVVLQIDPIETHLGHRSLLISFSSTGLTDSGIYQLIPVNGSTRYHFFAFFKTRELQGAGGPRFVVRDFYTQKSYFESDDLAEARDWTPINGEFEVVPESKLLILQIARVPAGSAIQGKLWISGIALSAGSE